MNRFLENVHFLVRCLRYRFRTERLQLATLLALNLEGATAIDIGANKGIYSFWLSKAVGPLGKVLAFEPQPEMFRYIEERAVSFGCGNVSTFGLALSETSGIAKLSRQRIGDGSASLQAERHREDGDVIKVPTAALDEIEGISNLKFIKCDVEGHELSVFQGARRVIGRFRPVVQFESTPDAVEPIAALFREIGYAGIVFLGSEYLPYSNPGNVPHPKFGMGGHRDFLFFPDEAVGTIIPKKIYRRFPSGSAANL